MISIYISLWYLNIRVNASSHVYEVDILGVQDLIQLQPFEGYA